LKGVVVEDTITVDVAVDATLETFADDDTFTELYYLLVRPGRTQTSRPHPQPSSI